MQIVNYALHLSRTLSFDWIKTLIWVNTCDPIRCGMWSWEDINLLSNRTYSNCESKNEWKKYYTHEIYLNVVVFCSAKSKDNIHRALRLPERKSSLKISILRSSRSCWMAEKMISSKSHLEKRSSECTQHINVNKSPKDEYSYTVWHMLIVCYRVCIWFG